MVYRIRDLVSLVINIYYKLKINVISNIKLLIRIKVTSNKILNIGRIIEQRI